MEQILITGTVTSGRADRKPLYSHIVEICHPYAKQIYSPLDTMNFHGSNEGRYQRALQLVSNSDVLIAEMSVPSTGQGIEVREACQKGVPMIVIAQSGSKISSLVLGSPILQEVLFYESLDDLTQNLNDVLCKLAKRTGVDH